MVRLVFGQDSWVEHLGVKSLHGRPVVLQIRAWAAAILPLVSNSCPGACQGAAPPRRGDAEGGVVRLLVPEVKKWCRPALGLFGVMLFRGARQCMGRVWANHITLHPKFAAAVRCLVTAAAHVGQVSAVLRACISHHAQVLGLGFVSFVGRFRIAPLPFRIVSAAF